MAWMRVGDQSPTEVHPDLQRERNTATFCPELLTNLLDGGKDQTDRRRQVVSTLFQNAAFDPKDSHFLSRWDSYGRALQKGTKLLSVGIQHGWNRDDFNHAVRSIRFDVGMGVHVIMFLPAIERLATDEQKAEWLPLAMSLKMIGTYAQTELGHGTNLRELQTTAEYNPTTQEFVLNTPFPTGMKWWPGGLGKSSNHVLLLAQLIVKGKRCGMQAFLVPIRSMETHKPLPGVEVGEIGPRLGLNTADNGFLILRDVHIPRTNMLMKYNRVTQDGDFTTGSEASRATYNTMVMVRTAIVDHCFMFVSHATTIATRYSAVRRQSELKPGDGEVQVLDFQTQQYKLFPNIALGYSFYYAQRDIAATYERMYKTELSKGNFTNVPEMHSQSCCLKAYATDLTTEAVDVCRRACGGHGYLLSSGLADLLQDCLAGVTYEGENTVLYLQTARYLVKAYTSTGGELTGTSAYLRGHLQAAPVHTATDCRNFHTLTTAFRTRALYMVRIAANNLQRALASGKPQHVAWNENSVDLVTAAKAHVDSYVAVTFMENVKQTTVCDPAIRDVLLTLATLHALHRIVVGAAQFLESGAISREQLELVRRQEVALLPKIRPNAVALVDAFDLHDFSLNSTLGSYDGQCYTRLYEHAKRNPLNQQQVHPGYFKYIKPIQEAALSAKL